MSTYLTVVFKDLSHINLESIMESDEWCALSRSHALEEKDRLEDFIRRLSNGEINDPEGESSELMEQMGWA